MQNFIFDYIGYIGADLTLALKQFVDSNLNQIGALTININSIGGSLSDGFLLYNYLKQQSFPIFTHNLGEVSSAAVLLYLSGSVRTCEEVAKFIIHPPSVNVNGDFTYHKLKEIFDSLAMDIDNYEKIINIITNNLNGKYNAHDLLCYDSLVLNKEQAYTCGIVTENDVSF